jgi:hypothetical protein
MQRRKFFGVLAAAATLPAVPPRYEMVYWLRAGDIIAIDGCGTYRVLNDVVSGAPKRAVQLKFLSSVVG